MSRTALLVGGAVAVVALATAGAWLTLPRDAQILRASVPGGNVSLTLSAGVQQQTTSVPVKSGRTTLLHVINTGGRLIVHSYAL